MSVVPRIVQAKLIYRTSTPKEFLASVAQLVPFVLLYGWVAYYVVLGFPHVVSAAAPSIAAFLATGVALWMHAPGPKKRLSRQGSKVKVGRDGIFSEETGFVGWSDIAKIEHRAVEQEVSLRFRSNAKISFVFEEDASEVAEEWRFFRREYERSKPDEFNFPHATKSHYRDSNRAALVRVAQNPRLAGAEAERLVAMSQADSALREDLEHELAEFANPDISGLTGDSEPNPI